jgi:protoporphyrinogen/coproporphyrinogen III oxidase
MSQSRRDFIKFVVAGTVASGCPVDPSAFVSAESKAGPPHVDGEHFEICHQVRDGHQFERPDATHKTDIVIIGGGMAGLSAAYFLRGKDWLLLEKEEHFGGNAYQQEYGGDAFATGSAYGYRDDFGDQLAREIGLKLLPVDMPDPTIVNQTFVADTWKSGLDHLPYSREVVASFRKFRDDMMKINLRDRVMELDAEPFSKYTGPYAAEVQRWWDGYGASNWGAFCEETSAFTGLANLQDVAGGGDASRVILPGGLGCITRKLVEVLQPQHKQRMLSGAAAVTVVQDRDGVRVTYIQGDKLTTVSAKVALVCTPKHITSRVVMGLPLEQKAAMRRTRYAPYPVVNVIFDKPVYNRGYDTWCPGNAFTDFIVADWTIRNTPGYRQKHNILSFYTPLRETQRATLLQEDDCRTLAANVLTDFQKLLPEFKADPVEVQIFRRGHPMFMAVPLQFTKNRLAASHPMERIFFGNADSGGPESLTSEAIRLSKAGAEWAEMVLAGKPGATELAEKALREGAF